MMASPDFPVKLTRGHEHKRKRIVSGDSVHLDEIVSGEIAGLTERLSK